MVRSQSPECANSGKLYGTASEGGNTSCSLSGCGTVFELVTPASFAGLQGQPDCIGKSVSPLAQRYGGLNAAAAALGYPNVPALQQAIMAFCEG